MPELRTLLDKQKELFFIGDLNINVITDNNKKIIKIGTPRSVKILERILSKYPCKQHNTFPNGSNRIIDIFLTSANCKLLINCYKSDNIFKFRPEPSHIVITTKFRCT